MSVIFYIAIHIIIYAAIIIIAVRNVYLLMLN